MKAIQYAQKVRKKLQNQNSISPRDPRSDWQIIRDFLSKGNRTIYNLPGRMGVTLIICLNDIDSSLSEEEARSLAWEGYCNFARIHKYLDRGEFSKSFRYSNIGTAALMYIEELIAVLMKREIMADKNYTFKTVERKEKKYYLEMR